MRRFPDFFVNCGYGGGRLPLPGEAALSGNSARRGGICCRRLPERKVYSVKIILIRTPGILSPLLRRLFGIRRQKPGR